jgi:hypothetical protein
MSADVDERLSIISADHITTTSAGATSGGPPCATWRMVCGLIREKKLSRTIDARQPGAGIAF